MSDERHKQFLAALAKVDAFIEDHPEYTREGLEQSVKGNTNQVVFANRGEEPVVFKIFCTTDRKARECFAMRHWQKTGLAPDLIWDDDPQMIIMSYVPGKFLGRGGETEADMVTACFEAGEAFGVLANVPWSSEDQATFDSPLYGQWDNIETEVATVMDKSRKIHSQNPAFDDQFWKNSLNFVESQLETILSQPRFLCHQDAVHFHIQSGHFTKFFDLEMCFVGGEAMQLGFILNELKELSDSTTRWRAFRTGWETGYGNTLSFASLQAAVAAHHWRCWDKITGYKSPPDPVRYRNMIESPTQIVLDNLL